MFKKLILLLTISLGISCASPKSTPYAFKTTINLENVTIARDTWGVPHIFGKTDAETAYGLAWANAEDSFDLMQEMYILTQGRMGRLKGKEGAAMDYFVHAIGTQKLVDEKFDTDLSPEYKKYLEGYCQGVNDYAKTHPEEVIMKKVFPITPRQIVQMYVIAFSALSGVAEAVEGAVKGDFDGKAKQALGSNAFAMNSTRTQDGKTYLCINPHFTVEGPFSFYEAHLSSEEGLNMTGSLFQGCTSLVMGANEHLGWAKTFNHFDRADVFQLTMHADKKLHYKFNDEWLELEKRPIWLKVKVLGFITLPVKKTTYWSKMGPVIKSEKGDFYAIRALAAMTIGAGEQYYRMNKATNFGEFKAALDMQKFSLFNIVYADKMDNIYYIHNGLYPDRPDEAHNWEKPITVCTTETCWQNPIPRTQMPQLENPECGYVFNTNNTPYHSSCAAEFLDPKGFSVYMDGRPDDNNRSERFMELVSQKETFSLKDFKAIKWDYQYPETSTFQKSIQPLYDLDPVKYPDIADYLAKLKTWNKIADLESVGATLTFLALNHIFDENGNLDEPFTMGVKADEALFVKAVRYGQAHLMEHFGTLEVPLKKVFIFARQDKEYPILGFPDMMMANYGFPYKDGKYKLTYADTYIQFAVFGPEGLEKTETLLPFNTLVKLDKFQDQLPLYNELKTKPMTLDKATVLKNAVATYSPALFF